MDNLTEIIKISARDHANKIAFRQANHEISYQQLATISNKLAYALVDNGLKKGDRVGIYMTRSIESVYAVYGILLAGGVFVPIDPQSPLARVEYILKDCQIAHLISIPSMVVNVRQVKTLETQVHCIYGVKLEDSSITCIGWDKLYKYQEKEPV